MEFTAIPRGDTGFHVTLGAGQWIIGPALYFVWLLGRWYPIAFGDAFVGGIDSGLGPGTAVADDQATLHAAATEEQEAEKYSYCFYDI